MARPWMQARSQRDIRRKLILDTIAFLWVVLLVVIGLPILLAPAPV